MFLDEITCSIINVYFMKVIIAFSRYSVRCLKTKKNQLCFISTLILCELQEWLQQTSITTNSINQGV